MGYVFTSKGSTGKNSVFNNSCKNQISCTYHLVAIITLVLALLLMCMITRKSQKQRLCARKSCVLFQNCWFHGGDAKIYFIEKFKLHEKLLLKTQKKHCTIIATRKLRLFCE